MLFGITSTCSFQRYPDALGPGLENLGVYFDVLGPKHWDTFETLENTWEILILKPCSWPQMPWYVPYYFC